MLKDTFPSGHNPISWSLAKVLISENCTTECLGLLSIEDFAVDYSTSRGEIKALDGVDLTVDNEVLGVVGESGCGKSTLGLSVIGLLPVPPARYARGRMMYKGIDLLR